MIDIRVKKNKNTALSIYDEKPKYLFNLNWIKYIDGITNKVRKVAKVRPKIIAHAMGPKNTILSPPR